MVYAGISMSDNERIVKSLTGFIHSLVIISAFLLIILFLQFLSGAYSSEFGGYPDEPAHYVTSVMVRDFLLHGTWTEPIKYAQEYYKHYPKVAFGHWPPLLYAVQGTWMMIFSESRASLLVELAVTSALAAYLLFFTVSKYFSGIAGFVSAGLLICLPIFQVYFDEEMAESLLLVTTFSSAIFFTRYLEQKRWQDNLWFAVFCSLAILTKGNGWALALIPPIALVLTRDWWVLKKPSFWISVPVVAGLCLPWQMLTLGMAQRGWTGGSKPSIAYTFQALGEFAVITKDLVGWAVILLAVIGFWTKVILPFRLKNVQPIFAVMTGLIVSMWVFHSVVPAGVEGRKMVNALPALLVFAVAGVQSLSQFVSQKVARGQLSLPRSYGIVTATAVVLFALQTFTIPRETHIGYTELSGFIEDRPELKNSVILVSSDRDGEGLLVSELAMRDRRPEHTILRATKLLSNSDWTGQVSEELCKTSTDVMRILDQQRVTAVVLDTFPERTHYLHNDLLVQALRSAPGSWQLTSTFADGKIQIFQLKKS